MNKSILKRMKEITFIYFLTLLIVVSLDLFSIIEFLLQYLVIYLFYINLLLIEKTVSTSIQSIYNKKNLLLGFAIAFIFLVHDLSGYNDALSIKLTILFIFSLGYLLISKNVKSLTNTDEKIEKPANTLNNVALLKSLDDSANVGLKDKKNTINTMIETQPLEVSKTQELKLSIVSKETSSVQSDTTKPLEIPKKSDKLKEFSILIVDDDLITIKILSNYLSLENYDITKALNGEEVIKLLDNGLKPDIIILDIIMPNMSGYEVCVEIRKKYPLYELPIVLLTGKNEVSGLVMGFDSGANDFLTKPVSKRELIARVKTHMELAKINNSYGKFVPREFLTFLGRESIIDVKLGDQVQLNMSIMFSDIRSFTSLSEKMTPIENFNFLNSYLIRISPAIRKNQGFIDKYIGDGIMALFPKDPENAIDAALEMLAQLKILNKERVQNNFEEISIGIGIHTGSLMLGTIGEEERMESTVISDAVNLSARMEDLTKSYSASIIISEQTLNQLKDKEKYKYRFLGKVQVKGKKKYVSIFEIYDVSNVNLLELRNKTEIYFNEAIKAYYNREFKKCIDFFEKVLEINPNDKIVYFYLDKIDALEKVGVLEKPLEVNGDL